MSSRIVMLDNDAKQQKMFKAINSKTTINVSIFSKHKPNDKQEKTSNIKINEAMAIELEIVKQRKQLRRNLKTLNYIMLLQANANMVKDPKKLEEIKNLKKDIQRQIVRNTKLLNNYRQLQQPLN